MSSVRSLRQADNFYFVNPKLTDSVNDYKTLNSGFVIPQLGGIFDVPRTPDDSRETKRVRMADRRMPRTNPPAGGPAYVRNPG